MSREIACPHDFIEEVDDEGCWYCGIVEEGLLFSGEWDTWVHKCCVIKARKVDAEDIEAKVFAKEFGLE